ncbi:hypothetical protein PHISP_07914 [Aspergillus sp. HF37]|nr:hypothetical protein PHISP_07914 [Aspergillus sp. HF37]
MPFQVKDKSERFKVPAFPENPNVFFGDLLGTERSNISNPIVGAWFRMEKGPEATPPMYEFDEFGVVIEGGLRSL